MSILSNPTVQAVVGGVVVYFLGICFDKLFIDPLTKYNELRSEICYCLTEYANAYSNPCCNAQDMTEWHKEAETELRKIASKAEAFAQEKKFLASSAIPPKSDLKEVAGWLRRLSNNMSDAYFEDNLKDANTVRLYLNLDVARRHGLACDVLNKQKRKAYERLCKKQVTHHDQL